MPSPEQELRSLDEEEARLWDLLGTGGDQDAREMLFATHAAYARTLARSQFKLRTGSDLDLADLEQLAFEGLLEAIDRFDRSRGIAFRAFASKRIIGNISDGIRRGSDLREQLAWSRRIRRDRIRSLSAPEALQPKPGALEELSDLAVGLAFGFLLEDTGMLTNEGPPAAAGPAAAWQSLAWTELKDALARELARLADREQAVLRSHYLQGLSFENVGALLGVSKGRVSQLHRSALETLRKRLASRGHFRFEE